MEALIGMIQTLVSSFLGQLWARDGQTFPACLAPRQREQLSLLVKTTEVGSIYVGDCFQARSTLGESCDELWD